MELTNPVNNNDNTKGKKNAPVTLVEYGDFECPYCLQAYPIVKEIQKIKGDNLRFVFRNFPLSNVHPHAAHAAYAAQAAGKQNKFWEMHDLIFENQQALEDEDLVAYAKALNLNINQFRNDMASEKIARKVKDDFMTGVRSGVGGTPTFFINGTRFDGPSELNLLLEAINSKLE
jgi:protein-disulfide isomerase